MDATREYHLAELAVARDPSDPRHLMPAIRPSDRAIIDIGCGAGQTLIAATVPTACRVVGVDVDRDALTLGRTLSDRVEFIHASAEAIPLPAASFDLAISRVALPYTDVPRAAREMARLLVPGGRCWVALHPVRMGARAFWHAMRERNAKAGLFTAYVLANGALLHTTGRVMRYPLQRARLESVQTIGGARRAFERAGFRDIQITREPFILTATR